MIETLAVALMALSAVSSFVGMIVCRNCCTARDDTQVHISSSSERFPAICLPSYGSLNQQDDQDVAMQATWTGTLSPKERNIGKGARKGTSPRSGTDASVTFSQVFLRSQQDKFQKDPELEMKASDDAMMETNVEEKMALSPTIFEDSAVTLSLEDQNVNGQVNANRNQTLHLVNPMRKEDSTSFSEISWTPTPNDQNAAPWTPHQSDFSPGEDEEASLLGIHFQGKDEYEYSYEYDGSENENENESEDGSKDESEDEHKSHTMVTYIPDFDHSGLTR